MKWAHPFRLYDKSSWIYTGDSLLCFLPRNIRIYRIVGRDFANLNHTYFKEIKYKETAHILLVRDGEMENTNGDLHRELCRNLSKVFPIYAYAFET